MMFIRLNRWLDLDPNPTGFGTPVGPSFTRWLPGGESDAIELLNTSAITLKVWFERHGATDDNEYICYKRGVKEVDATVMARQGRLDAGPLYGLLTLANLDEATRTAVREDRKDDQLYLELGKQFVKLAVPKLQRFVMLLRTVYGQHWLKDVPDWDSRTQSLGSYCLHWGMEWSFDQLDWKKFEPNKPSNTIHGGTWLIREDYSSYLTKEDWTNLEQLLQSDYKPSDAVEICNRARLLRDSGNLRHAIIEVVSALEIAVYAYVNRKCAVRFGSSISASFKQMTAPCRMALVGYLVPGVSPTDIELAADAIERRNSMVHQGAEVPDNATDLLEATMRVVLALFDGPHHKSPPNDGANKLFPLDTE